MRIAPTAQSTSSTNRQNASAELSSAPQLNWLVLVIGIAAISLLEGRLLYLMERPYLKATILSAELLVKGRPEWLADQSRILGPLVVAVLSLATHARFSACYLAFCGLCLFTANLLCYVLFFRVSGSRLLGWVYTLFYCAAFLVCQRNIMYLWDFAGMAISLLFAYLVFTQARPAAFIGLFALAVLNRESAAYIGIWLFLSAFAPRSALGRAGRFSGNIPQAALGAGLVLVGIAWSHLIRKLLYVRQTSPTSAGVPVIGGQLFTLPYNLRLLRHPFHGDTLLSLPIVLVIGVGMAALLWRYRALLVRRIVSGPPVAPLAILLAMMFADNLAFGALTAVRIWLEMLPFALFLIYTVFDSSAHTPPAQPEAPAVGSFVWSAPSAPVEAHPPSTD